MQLMQPELEEPDILLDSGSTISLFKDNMFLKDIWLAENKLVMKANTGSKLIQEKGIIPGYGDVWYDKNAVSNLFSLSDMVSRGLRVVYDSEKVDELVVYTKDECTIKFPVDERG